MQIRPCRFPDDYAAIAALLSRISHDPVTAEGLAEADARLPEGAVLHRVAAGDPLVGYAWARRFPWQAPGMFTLRAFVAPEARRQGLGTALLADVERFAREHGATDFTTFVRDDDPESLAYATGRGYEQFRHFFWSSLDLATFDASAFSEAVGKVEAEGIRFASLAEEPGEATERALYAVDRQASQDNPGEDFVEFPPFDEWRRLAVGRSDVRPDLVLFARDGDRVIAMTDMSLKPNGSVHTGFTGVLREYRGRGIALALKVLAAQAAARAGATQMCTENDSRNAAMLSVNRRLGYKPAPGLLELKRQA